MSLVWMGDAALRTLGCLSIKARKLASARRKEHPYDGRHRTPIKLSDFLSHAWATANDRARELGWIVDRPKPWEMGRGFVGE